MQHHPKGFTLVEIVVALAVLAALVTVGLPSFSRLLEGMRTTTTIDALTSHMTTGRMAAVTHGQPAVLCPAASPAACREGTDWSGGWILFLDRDGNRRPDHARDVLRADLSPTGGRLRVLSSAGRTHLRYLPDGRSAGSNLTLSICNRKQELLGTVVVNNAGRARSQWIRDQRPCPG